MAKVNIKGTDDKGRIVANIKHTPMLITELIHDFPKMSEADIYHALCVIRQSSEHDVRVARMFCETLKRKEDDNEKEQSR